MEEHCVASNSQHLTATHNTSHSQHITAHTHLQHTSYSQHAHTSHSQHLTARTHLTLTAPHSTSQHAHTSHSQHLAAHTHLTLTAPHTTQHLTLTAPHTTQHLTLTAPHSHLACTESQWPASVHTLTLSSPPSVLGAASGVRSLQRKNQHGALRTLGAHQTAASSPDICLLQLRRVALTRTAPANRLPQQQGPAETAL